MTSDASHPDARSGLKHLLTRREFLALAALGGVGAAVGGTWTVSLYASAFFDKLTITSYKINTPEWPADFPKLKIAFLSDLHIGCRSVSLDVVDKIVQQTNAIGADIILLGGDFLTFTKTKPWWDYIGPEAIAERLAPLDAPLGVYSVLGNHDWYSDGPGMKRALEKIAKIRVLENNAVYIPHGFEGFWLIGLADYLTRHPDYPGTMKRAKTSQPKIVLSHDPFTYKDMPNDALVQLSGHTHGGQVTLPFIGPVATPTPGTPFSWFYGMVQEDGRPPMIVTSGIGTSQLPIKNTPCEMVLLEIDSATT